jgi:Mycobacterium membrane protein
VSATYATIDGGNIGTAQDNAATPPWNKTLQVEDSFINGFSLTGQMNPVLDGSAPDGTTITCRITVDGEVVAEQTSTGQYAVVSCASN